MTTPRRSARRLVRRWWPVVLAVPLGAAVGAGYAVAADPSYAANAYVLVVAQNPGEATIATNFAQAYGRLAGQPQVLGVAAAETGHTRAELESLVHGTTSPDAPMIEITGTGERPQEAARTADAVARSLVAFANTSSKDTNVRLVTLSPAAAPDKPTTPSGKLDVAVGGATGLLLGALVLMPRRRGAPAAPEAVGSPATPPEPQAPQAARVPEASAASAPVAVPTTPRPRREEPAEPRTESKPDAGPKARPKAEPKTEPKAEAKTEAEPKSVKAPEKAEKKVEKKPAGKAAAQAAAEPPAAEQPPAETPAPAAGEQAPAQQKAPVGGGR
ncbi:Wzz/FepE/Etk N-terminal domain-containing protein [Kitasatospora sp. NPDC057512]|uniref:Wzz/FepE/Etk N-terminal domain-containing protein n=1 Tax=Kitasatospora sp. NPDC057512 TaxID=3346154 RepID=UPI0036A2CE03